MKHLSKILIGSILVSLTLFSPSKVLANNTCKADINQDSIVDLSDFTILVYSFFSAIPVNPRADINGDGFTDLSDYSILVNEFGKTCTPPTANHTPYQGQVPSVLEAIQAERFDEGGQGKAYNDLTPGNEGKFMRLSEDVDIKQSGAATVVGWMQSKEWMVYTVNVPATGNYRLEMRAGSLYSGRTLQIEITQGSATGVYPSLPVPVISRWEDLISFSPDATIYLTQGSAIIRILNSGPDWVDLDWIRFHSSTGGVNPTPSPISNPSPTAAPRPTPTPTAAPRPTPTPTPVPTPIPTPVPSPTPPTSSPAPISGRGYNPNAQADPTGYIPVSAATYVVATNGNDSNPGTMNQPFRTISKALSVVSPGQSVVVRNGTYNEKVLFSKQGTAQAPVLLQAETKHGVIITGATGGLQPAQWGGDDSGPNSHGNHYLTVRGIVIDNVTSFNRVLRASTGWKVDDVLISRVPFGINIRGHYVEVTDTIIRDVDSTDAHALVGTDGQSIRVSNVLLERVNTKLELKSIANSSITKFLFTKGLVLENITSRGHRGPGLWLDWDNKDFVIRNNIIENNQGYNYNWEGVALWIEGNGISRGKIYNNTMTGNSGAGIGILESTDIEIYGNIMTNNNQCMEFRNMFRGAERVLRNLNVHDNTCVSPTGGGMTTSIGDWGGWSPSSHNVIINRNTYRSMGNKPLFNWLGTQTYSIAETQSRLGFELNGKQE